MGNKSKKIAIIGASYLQLPLVLRANEMGYETFCFSYMEGAVCKDHCSAFYEISVVEKEKILTICRELSVDGVTSIASDLVVPTINYISSRLGLKGNSINSSALCTNKYLMKNCLRRAGLNVAQYAKIESEEDLYKIQDFSYPIIVELNT